MLDIGACPLHPTHTALKEGVKFLDLDIDMLLIRIHSLLKISIVRREILGNLFLELELEIITFNKHVTTRWLTIKIPMYNEGD